MTAAALVVILERADVLVEVRWARGADAEGVDLGPGEAVEIVEDHRAERLAEAGQLGGRLVEFAAFVIGADDEDAHVAPGGFLDGRPVEIVDEIPVEIDVIELAGGDRAQDQFYTAHAWKIR